MYRGIVFPGVFIYSRKVIWMRANNSFVPGGKRAGGAEYTRGADQTSGVDQASGAEYTKGADQTSGGKYVGGTGPVLPPCAYIPEGMPCMRQRGRFRQPPFHFCGQPFQVQRQPFQYQGQSLQVQRQPFQYLGLLHQYQRQPSSYIRFMNAVPGSQPVDIYANSSLIARNLPYKGFTEYMQVFPGIYNMTVFAAGTTGPVLLDAAVEIPVRSINTVALTGIPPALSIRPFFETVVQVPQGRLYLRFANLVPDSPEMDLALSNGTELFNNVSFGMVTNYLSVPAGTYIFYVKQSNTDNTLLYVPNMHLQEGRFCTIYTVGRMDGSVPLQVLIPLDGNSYIQVG